MTPRRRGLTLLFCAAAFSSGIPRVLSRTRPAAFLAPPLGAPSQGEEPLFETRFVSTVKHTQAHAASVVELKDGRLRAFWYSGSHEGAPDVEIKTAVYTTRDARWSKEEAVASPSRTGASLFRFVRKVGNPAVGRASDGRLVLFYVTASVGGWGGSSITTMDSLDEGASWSAPRRLTTSPFLNISTLVRCPPVLFADGTMGLPVYHEFLSQFGEILRLDASGSVVGVDRLGGIGGSLQPLLLVSSEAEASAFLRNSTNVRPRKVIGLRTLDAGRSWTPFDVPLKNPDSGLSGVALGGERLLLVLNDIERGRDVLSLVVSKDRGRSFKTLKRLEDESMAGARTFAEGPYLEEARGLALLTEKSIEDPEAYAESARDAMYWDHRFHFEFSYPSLIRTRDGDFHLLYGWNRSFVKHVHFNESWLEEQERRHAAGD